MSRRIELGPGGVFMVADRTILVDDRESVLADVSKIGADEHRLAYLFTFTGRVNNTTAADSVTVAMSPIDAFQFASDILDGLDLLAKAQRGDAQ